MRMWMIDPKLLCRKHLLGEHLEIHMFVGTINKGINVGVGVFAGTKFDMFLLRAGYNSALGLTLGAVYKF